MLRGSKLLTETVELKTHEDNKLRIICYQRTWQPPDFVVVRGLSNISGNCWLDKIISFFNDKQISLDIVSSFKNIDEDQVVVFLSMPKNEHDDLLKKML